MAIINSVGVGRGNKSVGEFSYRYGRGRTIASRRITSNKSKTPAQETQRQLFGFVTHLFEGMPKMMIEAISIKTKYGSARNNYIRQNWDYIKELLKSEPILKDKDADWVTLLNLIAEKTNKAINGIYPKPVIGNKDIISEIKTGEPNDANGTIELQILLREGLQSLEIKSLIDNNYRNFTAYDKSHPEKWQEVLKYNLQTNGLEIKYDDYTGIMDIKMQAKNFIEKLNKFSTAAYQSIWCIPAIWVNYKLVKTREAFSIDTV